MERSSVEPARIDGAAVLERLRELPGGRELLELARARDGEVALIGGAVRDLALERRPRELDVVVHDDAASFARELAGKLEDLAPASSPERVETTSHERFRTALVSWPGGQIDVAGRRSERYPAAGALPEVDVGTAEDDLARRDFTVNTLSVALNGPRPGALDGAPRALEDLRAGVLRVLHERSFLDDPTRLLRMARYRARLGFEPEEQTGAPGRAGDRGGCARDRLAGARRRRAAPGAGRARSGGGAESMRAARPADGAARGDRARRAALARGAGRAPGHAGGLAGRAAARLAAAPGAHLRHDRVRDAPARAARRLRVPGGRARARRAQRDPRPAHRRATAASATRRRRSTGWPAASRSRRSRSPAAIAEAAGHAEAAGAARRWLHELRGVRLQITGEDLLRAGIAPGPEIGRRLRRALIGKLDGELDGGEDERSAELAAALGDV